MKTLNQIRYEYINLRFTNPFATSLPQINLSEFTSNRLHKNILWTTHLNLILIQFPNALTQVFYSNRSSHRSIQQRSVSRPMTMMKAHRAGRGHSSVTLSFIHHPTHRLIHSSQSVRKFGMYVGRLSPGEMSVKRGA